MTKPAKWRLLVALMFAAYAVGMALLLLAAQRADGAGPPRCRPPDPAARPVVRLAAGELRALAALAWAEARGEGDGEPYCAMQAVAAVVVNRMRTNPRYFGASITQVLNRPFAFSPFGRDDPQRRKMSKVDESDRLYVTALLATIAAVSGADPVAGATHFYAGRTPHWAAAMLVTARIDRHTFLRAAP